MAQEDRGIGVGLGIGLLAGAAIGIGLGLLFAPKEGAALRRDIARRARELQDEAIDQQMALAAEGHLAGVVAALRPAAIGCLDTLRIEDGGCGLGGAPLQGAVPARNRSWIRCQEPSSPQFLKYP